MLRIDREASWTMVTPSRRASRFVCLPREALALFFCREHGVFFFLVAARSRSVGGESGVVASRRNFQTSALATAAFFFRAPRPAAMPSLSASAPRLN